jgi:IS30 family transposase
MAARRPRPKPAKLQTNAELRDLVQGALDQRWSPEQICWALPFQHPGLPPPTTAACLDTGKAT